MERVTGIGGIFFKARDRQAMLDWYATNLGIEAQEWGSTQFSWRDADDPERTGSTVWSVFPADTKYLDPSTAPFMVNYRVADLAAMLAQLRAAGVQVDEKVDDTEYGKFGWAMDPEGNRLELWEPPAGN
jgi:predicted enzyme related to lactoylglutathione lyase